MQDLTTLTTEELQALKIAIENEIAKRDAAGNGFFKEFSVSGKAVNPCTYKQIQFAEKLCEKTGSVIDSNNSQLIKRFEMEDMSEAIDLMKEGKRIRIY